MRAINELMELLVSVFFTTFQKEITHGGNYLESVPEEECIDIHIGEEIIRRFCNKEAETRLESIIKSQFFRKSIKDEASKPLLIIKQFLEKEKKLDNFDNQQKDKQSSEKPKKAESSPKPKTKNKKKRK